MRTDSKSVEVIAEKYDSLSLEYIRGRNHHAIHVSSQSSHRHTLNSLHQNNEMIQDCFDNESKKSVAAEVIRVSLMLGAFARFCNLMYCGSKDENDLFSVSKVLPPHHVVTHN